MFIFLRYKRINLSIPLNVKIRFFLAGVVIALHWITFFAAINTSNISITLAMFSTGAFFASLIEPLFYRRRIILYEIIFGLLVMVGVTMIMQVEGEYFMELFWEFYLLFVFTFCCSKWQVCSEL